MQQISKNQRFIQKAQAIHGNRYGYSLVQYTGTHIEVDIICPTHGVFKQLPSTHATKKACGCPKCAWEKLASERRAKTDEFVSKARQIYGDKYDYSSVIYMNNYTNIEIICPIHGRFTQLPWSHTSAKHECPKCSNVRKGNSIRIGLVSNTASFYIAQLWNDIEHFGKIGITTRHRIKDRFMGQLKGYKVEIYSHKPNLSIKDAVDCENKAKQIILESRYMPNTKFYGYSECFIWDTKIVQQLTQECI